MAISILGKQHGSVFIDVRRNVRGLIFGMGILGLTYRCQRCDIGGCVEGNDFICRPYWQTAEQLDRDGWAAVRSQGEWILVCPACKNRRKKFAA